MKWFATVTKARSESKKRNLSGFQKVHVFKWKFTKRNKPYFVGTELEWLNL